MSRNVNLLLLLSALLSALTGAQVGARPAQLAVAVAQAAEPAATVRRATASVAARPVAVLPRLAVLATAPAWVVVPAAPPLLSCRRE